MLQDHKDWLDKTVGPLLWRLCGTWIDLIGYASKVGNADYKKALSARRLEQVQKYITALKSGANFQKETALGAEQSGSDPTNNDGYFRAVEVYVYGFAPPPLKPRVEEKKKPTPQKFAIRVVGALSGGIGFAGADVIAFDIGEPKKGKWRRFIYVGGSVNLEVKVPKVLSALSTLGSGVSGPAVSFTTTVPCEIEDFAGAATLYKGPGLGIGPISVGGSIGLLIDKRESREEEGHHFSEGPQAFQRYRGGIGIGGAGKGRLILQ